MMNRLLIALMVFAGLFAGRLGNAVAAEAPTATRDVKTPWFDTSYPLVLLGVPPTEEDFQRMAEMGFNATLYYGFWFAGDPASSKSMEGIQAYLDLAQKHGLKVGFQLDGWRRVPREQLGLEQVRKIVRRFKDHPALGFWYLYDEPNILVSREKKLGYLKRISLKAYPKLLEGSKKALAKLTKEQKAMLEERTTPQELLPFYQAVKRESPGVPVCVTVTSDTTTWRGYEKTYDLFAFDSYPVFGLPFPRSDLRTVTDLNQRALRMGKPVLPILQVFNWNTLGDAWVK
jgi:hypothetical protein